MLHDSTYTWLGKGTQKIMLPGDWNEEKNLNLVKMFIVVSNIFIVVSYSRFKNKFFIVIVHDCTWQASHLPVFYSSTSHAIKEQSKKKIHDV